MQFHYSTSIPHCGGPLVIKKAITSGRIEGFRFVVCTVVQSDAVLMGSTTRQLVTECCKFRGCSSSVSL